MTWWTHRYWSRLSEVLVAEDPTRRRPGRSDGSEAFSDLALGQAEREIGHVPPQAARRLDRCGEDEAAHALDLTDLRTRSWMQLAFSRISGGHPPVRLSTDA